MKQFLFAASTVMMLFCNAPARSANTDPYPVTDSKKGLQVQMIDDAIALGVRHAALNLVLQTFLETEASPDALVWESDGQKYYFNRKAVEDYDKRVKQLSDTGAAVALILLNSLGSEAENKVMLPPNAPLNAPNRLYGFNTFTPDGVRYLKATMGFIANRYSQPGYPHGRVVGYIVGNEVNSHHSWYNLGETTPEILADHYEKATRITHSAVRKASTSARVYISLDHHWTAASHPNAKLGFPGKPLVDALVKLTKERGAFDWHIAYHPYPQNLRDPRFWNDTQALMHENTPKITFKNIDVLTTYLRKPEMLFNGQPRRVILSEQGLDTPNTPDGETIQAAAYAAAYVKINALDGIDSFILHRHVDHAKEGGLRLGLWTYKPGSISDPDRKKPIYEVFKAAGTAEQEKAFAFALPIVAAQSWQEFLAKK